MLVLFVVALAIGSCLCQSHNYRPYYADLLPGSYCESRPDTQKLYCCPSRTDDCSVPIRDTLCYCDQFCERGASGDCCPDYFTYCLGEIPPQPVSLSCKHNGKNIFPGGDAQDNCNLCKCVQTSETSAELMCDTARCLIQPELIDDINSQQRHYGWSAGNYSQFWGKKLATGLQSLLGTKYPGDMITQMYPITKIFDPRQLPRSFDVREKREWEGRIGSVVDQGWCGASWAFSTASTAADRLAIQTADDDRRVELSVQNVIDCGYTRTDGCLGGNLDRAWNYLRRYGVSESQCYPYTSGQTKTKGRCKTPRRSRQPHSLTCINGTSVELSQDDMIGMQPPYRIASKEEDIMHELYTSGPVQAIMQVHDDFFLYRTGVYRSTGLRPASRTAYHSVRILGWGEETNRYRGDTVKYWIAANSWGRQWGEHGLFRILRGENESDIETFVVGAWAKPSRGHGRRSRGYRNFRRFRRHHRHSQRGHRQNQTRKQ